MDIVKLIERYGLKRPRQLTCSITTNCNLRCEHCWVECDWVEKQGTNAPTKEVVRLINEFACLGGEVLHLTGGEPLSHPDFIEILNFCLNSKLDTVVLQTNATLLNRQLLAELPGENAHKLHFQVSLDGGSAETHEKVRGMGSFRMAINGLRLLVGEGYGGRTTIGFTEMRHNMHEVPDLIKLVMEMGIHSVIGWSLVDHGKAKHSEDLAPPTPEQYEKLLALYEADERFRRLYDKFGNFAAIEWFKGRDNPVGHSCVFIEKPYLSAGGDLYPCTLLQTDDFAAQDLFNSSLTDGIRNNLEIWANLRRNSIERQKGLECLRHCPGADHCAGGCFGRAKINNRGVRTCEDRCDLRRAVYSWSKSN